LYQAFEGNCGIQKGKADHLAMIDLKSGEETPCAGTLPYL